jgi:hypothetical protein
MDHFFSPNNKLYILIFKLPIIKKYEIETIVLHNPRVFKNKIYDCHKKKLVSIQSKEEREIPDGKIVDFYKPQKYFVLVKEDKTFKTIIKLDGTFLVNIGSKYHFDKDFVYYKKQEKFYKYDLLNNIDMEIKVSNEKEMIKSDIFEYRSDILTFSNSSNQIFIETTDN